MSQTQHTDATPVGGHIVSCYRKRHVFDSSAAARKYARQMANQKGGRMLRPYHCPWCGRIHLTSKP